MDQIIELWTKLLNYGPNYWIMEQIIELFALEPNILLH
jgi:hypothetical protein